MIKDFRPQELEELLNPPTKQEFRAALLAAAVLWITIITLCIAGLYL